MNAGQISWASDFTLGGIRDFRLDEHWKFGPGALYAFDFAPGYGGYGDSPHGTMIFVPLIAK